MSDLCTCKKPLVYGDLYPDSREALIAQLAECSAKLTEVTKARDNATSRYEHYRNLLYTAEAKAQELVEVVEVCIKDRNDSFLNQVSANSWNKLNSALKEFRGEK